MLVGLGRMEHPIADERVSRLEDGAADLIYQQELAVAVVHELKRAAIIESNHGDWRRGIVTFMATR